MSGAHNKQVQNRFLEIIIHLVPADEIPVNSSKEVVDPEFSLLISQALSHKPYKADA